MSGSEVIASAGATDTGKAKQQTAILTWLGIVLVLFALGEIGIGVVSLLRQDAQGANAVREDAKSFILYILGVFSGALAPHALASLQRKDADGT